MTSTSARRHYYATQATEAVQEARDAEYDAALAQLRPHYDELLAAIKAALPVVQVSPILAAKIRDLIARVEEPPSKSALTIPNASSGQVDDTGTPP